MGDHKVGVEKWNTYSLAEKLGLDIPKTWCPRTPKDLAAIDADFPLGIKPAVKEDFFYATKAKAWRANNREELTSLGKKLRFTRVSMKSRSRNYPRRRQLSVLLLRTF